MWVYGGKCRHEQHRLPPTQTAFRPRRPARPRPRTPPKNFRQNQLNIRGTVHKLIIRASLWLAQCTPHICTLINPYAQTGEGLHQLER